MKRFVLLFLITLLTTITSSSQSISKETEKDSTVVITSSQLKETNLIFAEHSKLLIENELLYKQLNNYKTDVNILIATDSLRRKQIDTFKELTVVQQDHINKLNSKIKKKENSLKLWRIGGVTVSASFLLLFLLK